MSRLYWADPSDPTHATIGLDLDDLDATGIIVRRIDWGTIAKDLSWYTGGDVPGGEQIRAHPGPVLGELEIFADLDDLETLLETYQLFGQFLESEAVLVWQPTGVSVPRYFDTYASDVPALWRGVQSQGAFLDPGGLDQDYVVRFWHHPYPRRDPVTLLDGVTLSNAVGDNVATFTNPGSALSEARLEIEVPGSEWITQIRVGFRHGDSDEFAADLSGYTLTETTVVDSWRVIDRHVLTPAEPENFVGTYRVVATVRLEEDVFHFQLYHGATRDEDQPLGEPNEEVIYDATDLTNFAPFVELELGLVTYDAESPDLVIELHAWSEGSANVTEWGDVYLIPADDGAFVYRSPGYGSGVGGEVFKGELFDLSGGANLNDDDAVILDTVGATAEAKPTAGRTLAVGPHILSFRGSAHNRSRDRRKLAEMRVEKNGSTDHAIGIHSKRGRPVTYYGGELSRRIDFRVTNTSDVYEFLVEEIEATSPLRWTKVAAISHRYVAPITDGRRLAVDAGTRRARIEDPDGARIAALRATGLPFLEPGPGALAILAGEIATAGYSHVDERGVLPKIDTATQVLVTLVVTPRDLQA